MKTKYISHGLSLTEGQKVTLANAARNGTGATIRLTYRQLHGEDNLGLTKGQANRVAKNLDQGRGMELRFTKTQMKHMTKNGGFLPLLALIPLIAKGLAAVGVAAGGAAGVATAVNAKQAADAALVEAQRAARVKEAETQRHNRALEAELHGKGLYLGRQTTGGCCPRCKGSGLYLGKKN